MSFLKHTFIIVVQNFLFLSRPTDGSNFFNEIQLEYVIYWGQVLKQCQDNRFREGWPSGKRGLYFIHVDNIVSLSNHKM